MTTQRDSTTEPIAGRLAVGLAKLGLAARHRAWEGATRAGLTPTQGQILAYLLNHPEGARPGEISEALGVTAATVSDSAAALATKGYLSRASDPTDKRAVRLVLTDVGKDVAAAAAQWSDVLLAAVDALAPEEQIVLLRSIIKMIRALQIRGAIPIARMCVNCQYFRPYAHRDALRPHHCAFVNAPFGDADLRIDCSDFIASREEERGLAWARFSSGAAG
ncbi:MAG: MarR family transcriptional regulator [Chloroflexota bacterium]